MTFSKLGTDTETNQLVYLPKASRLQGFYIIGIQGTGKSGLIENLIMQDIDQQIGVCVLDPHGELIDHVIARLPGKAEEEKVVLLDITDEDYPFGLNLFTCSNPKSAVAVQYVVDQIMHVFEKLLGVSHDTPLILQYLRNCTYTLIANPGYTMAEIPLLLTDRNCRQQLVANVQRLQTRLFWQQYDQMKPGEQIEQMASIQRRVDDFLQDLILPIVGQANTTINVQKIMDEGKILLVKLSPQLDSVSSLIGSLFIALLLNAAYARPTNKRRQFHVYADEFERFATEDFATLLEQARKFGIATTIAHQNRGQLNSANSKLETDLKDRSRSVGNMVVFRVNSKDADDLAGEFQITPEEARLEVLKEEWHDRIEEAVEDGEEEIKTPVKDVVGHLLKGGTHSNPVVNEFATRVLHRLRAIPITPDEEQYWSELNRLFYQAMTGTPIEQLVPSVRLIHTFLARIGLGFPYTLESYSAFSRLWHASENSNEYSKALEQLDNHAKMVLRKQRLNDLHRLLMDVETKYERDLYNALKWSPEMLQEQWGKPLPLSPQEWGRHKKNSSLRSYYLQMKEWSFYHPAPFQWFHVDIESLEWEKNGEELYWMYRSGYKVDSENLLVKNVYDPLYGYAPSVYVLCHQLVPGQETKFYNEADLTEVIEVELQEQKQIFLGFIQDLKDVMEALADEPIMVGSGLYRPRPRKQIHYLPHARETLTHPQRPYADIRNEIANELSSLPNFTARIRITVEGQTVEHTIKMLEPEKGLYGKPLQERIARIQAQNRRDGYTRARAAIEAEILQRQQSFQPVPVSPPVPQPQLAQRHARTVVVQGKCPNCGASNALGAKFCNQCGTKL